VTLVAGRDITNHFNAVIPTQLICDSTGKGTCLVSRRDASIALRRLTPTQLVFALPWQRSVGA
jgi:hypothetical protein